MTEEQRKEFERLKEKLLKLRAFRDTHGDLTKNGTHFKLIIEQTLAGNSEIHEKDLMQPGDPAPEPNKSRIRGRTPVVRNALADYFDGPGRSEPYAIQIPLRNLVAELVANQPSDPRLVDEFWNHHRSTLYTTTIIYADLLFFRFKSLYVRDILVNDEQSADRILGGALQLPDSPIPSAHYLSAGEMVAAFKLFQVLRVPVKRARGGSYLLAGSLTAVGSNAVPRLEELGDGSAILLGSARTHRLIADLQSERRFAVQVSENSVVRLDADGAVLQEWTDDEAVPALETFSKFVAVTRCPGPKNMKPLTIVCGNHGRAIQGAVDYLSNGKLLRRVFDELEAGSSSLPEFFQLVLRVPIFRTRQEAEVDVNKTVIEYAYSKSAAELAAPGAAPQRHIGSAGAAVRRVPVVPAPRPSSASRNRR